MSSGKRNLDAENPKSAPNSKKRRKVQSSNPNATQNQQQQADDKFLKKVCVYILPAGIEKARMEIFKSQLIKFGGHLLNKLNSEATHLVVADNMEIDRMCRLLKLDSPPLDVSIVKTTWLSSCFRLKTLVDTKEYEIAIAKHLPDKEKAMEMETNIERKLAGTDNVESSSTAETRIPNPSRDENIKEEFPKVGIMWRAFKKPMKEVVTKEELGDDADSDYAPSDGEGATKGEHSDSYSSEEESSGVPKGSSSSTTPDTSPVKNLPRGHWVCAQSSKNPLPNVNKHITDKLEEMVKTYQSTNDRWRALGYQKAIQALRKQPKPISSWEEAKGVPGVGVRLADKIWEIAESGELRKLNEFRSNEELQIINIFTDVWGAGAHTARTWYQQGFRSLDDLQNKAKLTKQQKIGLRCYDDFLNRMPRSEVEEIEKTVKAIAEEIVPGTRCEVCGSYRRGKPTCGDIDILITHPDGHSHKGIFAKILGRLREKGFLTDDLVSGEENGNQKKYMGVFKLHGENRKHRRIDIIVTPVEEYACALVHFTGSAHFNRSIRHLAKKTGMSLSEHALRTGVIRKAGEKVYEGTALPTPTEESIFQHMGIPYRPPEERDH